MKRLKHSFLLKREEKFNLFLNLDYPLFTTVILVTIFGLIMVYDASVVQAYKDFADKYYYIKQQIVWAILGIILMMVAFIFKYTNYKKISLPLLLGSFVLLIAVLIPGLGSQAGGAHRWLDLRVVTIQPAELIKITSIIFFASLFEKRVRTFAFLNVVFLVTIIVGLLQKDLGTSIVFFLTSLAMYIVAGAKLTYLLAMVPMATIGFVLFTVTSSYRRQRVLGFLDPFADPQGYTYHISQVLIALGSGGLFGLGLGQSRQKFEYIPEVTTDSIFAIVGEEFGFLGALFLTILLSILVWRGFRIAKNCQDRFGKILAVGLTSWLGIQILVNLGAMVSLIPLTGVPLPFISYGGSALLANLVAVGILLNISKYNNSQVK